MKGFVKEWSNIGGMSKIWNENDLLFVTRIFGEIELLPGLSPKLKS